MATNSGVPYRVFNQYERASSEDSNDAQLFGSQSVMDIFRSLFFASGASSGGFVQETQPSTLTTPLTAFVSGGLLVNPQSTDLLVDPGVLLAIAPETTPDSRDSVCVVANSPGVTSPGVLTFTSNAGGGPRWDLLECRPQQTSTSDSRDIFDPVTQQFTSTSVPKLITTDLEFRLRLGTGASPAPAPTLESGWLPIAAVWTPNTASSFDDCEIFDVRPLVSDLTEFGTGGKVPDISGINWNLTGDDGPDQTRFRGGFKTTYGGIGKKFTVQGSLRACLPGISSNDQINAKDLDYHPSGDVQTSTWFTMCAVFPFGLPKWARLAVPADAISGRRWPCDMDGIYCQTTMNQMDSRMDVLTELPRAWDTVSTTYTANAIGAVAFSADGGPGTYTTEFHSMVGGVIQTNNDLTPPRFLNGDPMRDPTPGASSGLPVGPISNLRLSALVLSAATDWIVGSNIGTDDAYAKRVFLQGLTAGTSGRSEVEVDAPLAQGVDSTLNAVVGAGVDGTAYVELRGFTFSPWIST